MRPLWLSVRRPRLSSPTVGEDIKVDITNNVFDFMVITCVVMVSPITIITLVTKQMILDELKETTFLRNCSTSFKFDLYTILCLIILGNSIVITQTVLFVCRFWRGKHLCAVIQSIK